MIRIFCVYFILLSIFIISCNISGPQPVPPGASFLVAQESPTPVSLEVRLNGSPFLDTLSYTSYSKYSISGQGNYSFQFYIPGTDTLIYSSDNYPLQAGVHYSFFLIDSINDLQAALLSDNLTVPKDSTSKIRFMQFSPIGTGDSIPDSLVNFAIHNSDTLSMHRSFNDESANPALDSFLTISSGIYKFDVVLDSTTNVILTTPSDTLLPGKIYTLLLTGLTNLNGTPGAFRSCLIKHN